MSKNLRSGNVYILKLNSLDGRLESIEIGRHSYSYVLEKKRKKRKKKKEWWNVLRSTIKVLVNGIELIRYKFTDCRDIDLFAFNHCNIFI